MGMYNSAPCDNAAVVVPSDTTILPPFQQLYIGGAGNVAVTTVNGNVVTFTAPPVGSIIPIRGTKVLATNTTATLIIAMW
jgi:hypothetical protein